MTSVVLPFLRDFSLCSAAASCPPPARGFRQGEHEARGGARWRRGRGWRRPRGWTSRPRGRLSQAGEVAPAPPPHPRSARPAPPRRGGPEGPLAARDPRPLLLLRPPPSPPPRHRPSERASSGPPASVGDARADDHEGSASFSMGVGRKEGGGSA